MFSFSDISRKYSIVEKAVAAPMKPESKDGFRAWWENLKRRILGE